MHNNAHIMNTITHYANRFGQTIRHRFKDPRKLEKEFKLTPHPIQKSRVTLLLEAHVIPSIAALIESYYNGPLLIIPNPINVFTDRFMVHYDAIDPFMGYCKKGVKIHRLAHFSNCQPVTIKDEQFSISDGWDGWDDYKHRGPNMYCLNLSTFVTKCVCALYGYPTLGKLNDHLYIIGYKRKRDIGKSTSVVRLDKKGDKYKFVSVATTLYPRYNASVVTIDSHMFVIGGTECCNTIEVFDGSRWTLLSVRLNRPHKNDVYGNAVAIDYKIYIRTRDVIEVYDTLKGSNGSFKLSSFALSPIKGIIFRTSHHLVAYKNKLILVAWQTTLNLSNFYCYDEKLRKWNKLPLCHDGNIFAYAMFVV